MQLAYQRPSGSTPEDLIVYQSLGFVDEWSRHDVPDLADDHPALLAHARAALARRQAAYPGMVARGEVTAELAEADQAAWRDLAGEWEWIVTGAGVPPHPLSLRARIAAVDLALERIERERGRPGMGQRADLIQQQELNLALRWHLTRLKFGAPAIHFWAECNQLLRERAQRPTAAPVCSTCERSAADPVTFACTRTDCGLRHKDAA